MTFLESKNDQKNSLKQPALSKTTNEKLIAVSNVLYPHSKPKNTWAQRLLGGHDHD